ncbi:hypothetical protein ACQI4E_31435 [Streptomyces sp. CA-252508]|uniref:hypothetical protein n=1 Tax=Streptomyces sp. CA-252508 TaxID=3418946 RepID=UPI003D8B2B5F
MDVEENVRILGDLAPLFDQTVLMGYPPAVKDILVTAEEAGVGIGELNMASRVLGGEPSPSGGVRSGAPAHRRHRVAEHIDQHLRNGRRRDRRHGIAADGARTRLAAG